ncbi:hypothetical protein OAB00_03730 [Akkermansiaceae bacterium]|nr:hypothetical protein [Akkermansiaceae bacterium]
MGSEQAGQHNAIWYTLIESIRRRKLNPRAYLVWLFEELPTIKVNKNTFAQYTPSAYAQTLKKHPLKQKHHKRRRLTTYDIYDYDVLGKTLTFKFIYIQKINMELFNSLHYSFLFCLPLRPRSTIYVYYKTISVCFSVKKFLLKSQSNQNNITGRYFCYYNRFKKTAYLEFFKTERAIFLNGCLFNIFIACKIDGRVWCVPRVGTLC